MSLLEKGRIAILSTLNGLLDKQIDENSTEAVKQYVRDLEGDIAKTNTFYAESLASIRTLNRQLVEDNNRIKELNKVIEYILSDNDPTNDNLAVAKQVEIDTLQSTIDENNVVLAETQQTVDAVSQTIGNLNSKHQSMLQQLRNVESRERNSKAKAQAADALTSFKKLLSNDPNASVDNIMVRARRQSDVADVKLEQALKGVNDVNSGVDTSMLNAKAKIEARKKQMAEKPL